jgi:RND superfamily putative drug exporter
MSSVAASSHPSAIVRLAEWSYRRRRLVLALWIVALVVISIVAQKVGADYGMSFSTPGSDSNAAQALLGDHFPARSGDNVDLVFRADDGIAAARPRIEQVLAKAAAVPQVGAVVSPFAPEGARQVAPDGRIGFASLRLTTTYQQDFPRTSGHDLIDLAKDSSKEGLQVEVSGFAIQAAQQGNFSSEGIGILVAALILLISFGSVLAMGLPIITAVVGLGIGTALITVLTHVLEVPEFAPQVAAMIGIGVGIDYVLFIVTRYRASLETGHEPHQAVLTAMNTSGRAVLFAGCTVIISLLGLFIMNIGFLRGLAVGAVSVVLVVMLAAVTLLPALLGFVGRTIDRLHVPFTNKRLAGDRRSLSFRWSRVVQRRPWPAAILCAAVLLALAAPLFSLRFGFPDAGFDSKDLTTRRAYDLMAEGFGAGVSGPLLLVADASAGGQQVLPAVQQKVQADADVAFVAPPVPSPDGKVALLVVYPKSGPASVQTEQLVKRLRSDVIAPVRDGTQKPVLVGGSTAASIDASRYIADRLLLFIGAVIVLSFLLLLVVFRSLLVPLKAAVMNVLSISAAYGVISMVVKGGWLGGLIGIHEPVPVPSFIPMMMFAIIFGLSMDYEVFLLSRVREEYVRTGDNALAVADGLAATARVITAAALIMISVFLAFVLADDVTLKTVGVGLATAIFVDATLVRMVLVPATMELLGDANWWLPAWLDKHLPEVHVEGKGEEELEAELGHLLVEEPAPAK